MILIKFLVEMMIVYFLIRSKQIAKSYKISLPVFGVYYFLLLAIFINYSLVVWDSFCVMLQLACAGDLETPLFLATIYKEFSGFFLTLSMMGIYFATKSNRNNKQKSATAI